MYCPITGCPLCSYFCVPSSTRPCPNLVFPNVLPHPTWPNYLHVVHLRLLGSALSLRYKSSPMGLLLPGLAGLSGCVCVCVLVLQLWLPGNWTGTLCVTSGSLLSGMVEKTRFLLEGI